MGVEEGRLITIHPRRVIVLLLSITAALSIVSMVAAVSLRLSLENSLWIESRESFVRLFYVDLETNIPAWFSSVILSSYVTPVSLA